MNSCPEGLPPFPSPDASTLWTHSTLGLWRVLVLRLPCDPGNRFNWVPTQDRLAPCCRWKASRRACDHGVITALKACRVNVGCVAPCDSSDQKAGAVFQVAPGNRFFFAGARSFLGVIRGKAVCLKVGDAVKAVFAQSFPLERQKSALLPHLSRSNSHPQRVPRDPLGL